MKKLLVGSLAMSLCLGALAAPKPLVVCTGGEGGAYEALGGQIGHDIGKKIGAEVEILNTGGSIENAEKLSDGTCSMAIMQADAVVSQSVPRDLTVTNAHSEAIYWIHGKDGLKNFADISDKKNAKFAVAVVAGSGAVVTMDNFGLVDKDYKDVRTVEFDDWYGAAEAAANGFTMKASVNIPIAGLLYVGRPKFIPKDITEDFGKQLTVGEVDESSFTDAKDSNGRPLYVDCKIGSGDVGTLKTDTWTDPDTICMSAQVVYNNAYHSDLPTKEARDVKRAVAKGINSNLKAVRQ